MAPNTHCPTIKKTVDIFISGYILTKEMVRHLCLLQYGASEALLNNCGPLDYATLYFEKHKAMDAPYLIPMTFHHRDDPNKTLDLWLLPGKAAFFSHGVTPPKLPLDEETKAYLDQWFSPELLKMKQFRGVRYIQTLWPRGVLPRGIIAAKMKLTVEKHRAAYEKVQQDWVEWMKAKGVENPVMPPPFPVSWHLA
ncbi:hypothetical protein C8Q76DRAFT_795114 [Earliella scabrosa]|nr:hypothetical protein C8Q76DRAFT_795114 [Earliella scabrosa]